MSNIVNISFNVWGTEESAADLKREIGRFIDEQGAQGRMVTADKLADAIRKWKDNPLVKTTIINYFR